jgi:hypothetical protein
MTLGKPTLLVKSDVAIIAIQDAFVTCKLVSQITQVVDDSFPKALSYTRLSHHELDKGGNFRYLPRVALSTTTSSM